MLPQTILKASLSPKNQQSYILTPKKLNLKLLTKESAPIFCEKTSISLQEIRKDFPDAPIGM